MKTERRQNKGTSIGVHNEKACEHYLWHDKT